MKYNSNSDGRSRQILILWICSGLVLGMAIGAGIGAAYEDMLALMGVGAGLGMGLGAAGGVLKLQRE